MTRKYLITGAEQGLGQEIKARLEDSLLEVHNMPGMVIREGYHAIRNFLRNDLPEGITHVINNYGINHLSWIGTTPEEDEQIMSVNVMGPYWIINHLVALGEGPCRVVNIASQTYRVPQRTTAIYCASKAALVHMTRVMARELAPKGWVINAVAPGRIPDTGMSRLTDEQVLDLRGWTAKESEEYAASLIPMGRATSRKEVAEAVLKIFELPAYINGTVIDMMGGV